MSRFILLENIYGDADLLDNLEPIIESIYRPVGKKEWNEIVKLLNELDEENQRFKQAFEKTMENAFDRNMDSKIAEEVIDYIHVSFYEFLKMEDLE